MVQCNLSCSVSWPAVVRLVSHKLQHWTVHANVFAKVFQTLTSAILYYFCDFDLGRGS